LNLEELQEQLLEVCDINVSVQTISRTLRRHGFSRTVTLILPGHDITNEYPYDGVEQHGRVCSRELTLRPLKSGKLSKSHKYGSGMIMGSYRSFYTAGLTGYWADISSSQAATPSKPVIV
jgi:hypothetical protein